MKIAMVSEHANPLAALGGLECGGQNVHVAELAAALARGGHEVVVYTRRDDQRQLRRYRAHDADSSLRVTSATKRTSRVVGRVSAMLGVAPT